MSTPQPIWLQIHTYLQTQLPDMLRFLERLVRAESPTLEPSSQTEVQELLMEALRRLDFDVEHIPGQISGGQIFAKPYRLDPTQPKQLLLGHSDTVWPIGTLREFPVVQTGNELRGPGIFDMKAGLTQMVFALRALHQLQLSPSVAPFVFINSDEEIGSPDSQPRLKQLAQQMRRVWVLEPSLGPTGEIKTARKGVGHFTITAYGWAAHAGLEPGRGASAIVGMSNVIQQLTALNDLDAGISVNVGTVQGGERPNVIASECKIEVDVRVPRLADADYIEQAIRGIKPQVPIVLLDVAGQMSHPPLEFSARNQALWQMTERLAGEMGLALTHTAVGGGSDGNFTSLYTATLDGLGAVGGGAHARHEFIYIDRLVERSTLLALLLLEPDLPLDVEVIE
jgi:glutamate carboxypeptidase